MAPKRSPTSRRAEWEASVSETFAAASEKIAAGVNPFETIVFEASSNDIGTLTLSTNKGKPVKVHDTGGRIPDEHTMAAVTADAKKLGIFPFGKTEKTEADKPDDTPTE